MKWLFLLILMANFHGMLAESIRDFRFLKEYSEEEGWQKAYSGEEREKSIEKKTSTPTPEQEPLPSKIFAD